MSGIWRNYRDGREAEWAHLAESRNMASVRNLVSLEFRSCPALSRLDEIDPDEMELLSRTHVPLGYTQFRRLPLSKR